MKFFPKIVYVDEINLENSFGMFMQNDTRRGAFLGFLEDSSSIILVKRRKWAWTTLLHELCHWVAFKICHSHWWADDFIDKYIKSWPRY